MLSYSDVNDDVWAVDWGLTDETGSPARLQRVSAKGRNGVRVNDVDFSVEAGQTVAIVGPARAGKTTLLELLVGARSPIDGEVRVFGRDPREPAARTRLGICPLDCLIPTDATVEDTLRATLNWCGRAEGIDQAMREIHMDSVAHTPFAMLPASIRNRLMLDIAFAGNPRLVTLDEPSADLSWEDRLATWDYLRKKRSPDRSIVFTTGVFDESLALADVMILLDGGNVIATGNPATLRHEPLARVIRFRPDRPTLPTPLGLRGVVSIEEDQHVISLHTLRPTETLGDLISLGVPLTDIVIDQEPLTDAFPRPRH